MAHESVERHRIAGIDERARGFNRQIEVLRTESGFQAVFQYEATKVLSVSCPSTDGAMKDLVSQLHARGYMQLHSQLNFRDQQYLGSQEPVVDYADPPRGLIAGLRALLGLRARQTSEPGV